MHAELSDVDLTVIIPVHNAMETIGSLITEILGTPGLRVEAIAVDDASTDDSIAAITAVGSDAVTVIPLEVNRGAGYARNQGFRLATGRYTLFFDADDEIDTATVTRAVAALDTTHADVAFLPYRYRRGHNPTTTSMNNYDQMVWTQYMSGAGQRVAQLTEVPRLLGFSNYPWNKIIRTSSYLDGRLRFGETTVHNDILGHWMTMLGADTLVLLDQVIGTHTVSAQGQNLSNRMGRERLQLFEALNETYSMLEAHPQLRDRYSHHYWDFALRVSQWALSRVDMRIAKEAQICLQRHLLRMNLVDLARMRTRRNPRLVDQIIRQTAV